MEDPLEEEKEDKNDTETLGMKELQDKIQELEHRMEQTKNDQVRSGLGKVLAGLKSQRGHSRRCSEQDTEDGKEALSDAQSGDETESQNEHSI
jgi:hypothetical protein